MIIAGLAWLAIFMTISPTFVRVRDGLIVQMTEVWTDVSRTAPVGTRPDLGLDAPELAAVYADNARRILALGD